MRPTHLELLRRLAINDEHALSQLMDGRAIDSPLLDDKTSALVNVATLVAMEAGSPSYQWAVDSAHAAGAEDAEIIDILRAVAPVVGVARLNAAAVALALAFGHDLGSHP